MKTRTHQQPHRTILRRWREGGDSLAELECGHTEPANGLDLATAVRCQQCNPVRLPDAPALPPVRDTYGRPV